jgi:hypothetical protein
MTPKTLDTTGVVLIVLATVGWLLIAINVSFVAGQSGEGDAAMGKALSTFATLAFVVVTWLLMAALLIRATSQDVMPSWAGFVAAILMLLSGAAAIASMFLLGDPSIRWPAVIPVVVPVLILAYVVCAYLPALSAAMARPQIGGLFWAAVLLLSLAPWPAVARRREKSAQARVAAEKIREQQTQAADEQKKAAALAQIQQMKANSHLWDWLTLLDAESGVQQEALAAFRANLNRQDDVESWLGNSISTMGYVAALDIKPTPKLCDAAKRWCKKFSDNMQPQNGQPSYYEEKKLLDPAMSGLRWFYANGCSLDEGVASIEAGVRAYRDTPHRQQMLLQLDELRRTSPGAAGLKK